MTWEPPPHLLGEPAYLRAAAEHVGYSASYVTNLERIDVSALVIPNQRNGSLARGLEANERSALVEFVLDGGLLIVAGSFRQRDVELLDSLFGFQLAGIESSSASRFYLRTPDADDTPFALTPDEIESHAHTTIETSSLPTDALSLFQREDRTLAALLTHGDGNAIYLGPIYLSARPLGSIDGGWLALLEAALRVSGSPLDRPPAVEFSPEHLFVSANISPVLSLGAFGSAPLTYQWYRGEEPVASATNALLAFSASGTNLSGFYYALASNAFGAATSGVALLTVAPPALPVTVFDHPDYVQTGGGPTDESDAVQSSIRFLGYDVETVTDFTRLTNLLLVIPSLTQDDLGSTLALEEAEAVVDHVSRGGTLIVHGDASGRGIALLQRLFEWDFGFRQAATGGICRGQPITHRSLLHYAPAAILTHEGSYSLTPESLPPGGITAYTDDDGDVIVAELPWLRGRVIYLGWNWRFAVPLGTRDSGWLTVLAAALAEGWFPDLHPVLAITRPNDSSELQLSLRGTPLARIELQHSIDLLGGWISETNSLPASGVWRMPLPLETTLPRVFYRTFEP